MAKLESTVRQGAERVKQTMEKAAALLPGESIRDAAPYGDFHLMPIAGQWRAGRSGKELQVIDPYTEQTMLGIPAANAEDIDEAYRKAAEVQLDWAAQPPQVRREVFLRAAEIMVRRRDETCGWLMHEGGGTQLKAQIEWQLVHEVMLEASTYPLRMEGHILPSLVPGKRSHVYRRAAGVVGVIGPWDFALQLSNRSVAAALATGNGVVLKAAVETPVSGGLLLARLYDEAGLPPGLFSVICGSTENFGDAFIDHPVPAVISFTGSTNAGRHIAATAARQVKRLCLELGGNSSFIVLSDADLDVAVNAAIAGKFLNAGQICMAINRILVDRSVYPQFLQRFTERARRLRAGNPAESGVDVGPMISRKQLQRTLALADATIEAGAKVELRNPPHGLVLPPMVLSEVTNDMPGAQDELFGPVALVMPFDGDEQALKIANNTPYGLSSSVCTRDLTRGLRLAQRMQTGMVHVNDMPVNDEAHAPFGGVKQSGYGRFGGWWALNEFTNEQWITLQESPRNYGI